MMDLWPLSPISTPGRAPGETFPMHKHGPDELVGPVRGSTAWWRGMGARPDESAEGPHVTPRRKARSSKNGYGPGVRTERVARDRAAIAAGTYDTPARWEAALDRLLDRLDGR